MASSNCTDHTSMTDRVASISGKLSLMVALFLGIMGLIGYNIHATQQIEVRVAQEIAKIGGQLAGCSLRLKHLEAAVAGNGLRIDDHEQRLRSIERRQGE